MVLTDTADKIKSMEVRGAGRIARAAALALAEHAESLDSTDIMQFSGEMKRAAELLAGTRPTAVSLPNAVNIVMASIAHAMTVPEAKMMIGSKAREFVQSSNQAVERIGKIGARHIRDGDVILTHCNSEAALACLIEAKRSGKEFSVFATEVRPRNQGLLTIRVLNEAGITTNFIVDSAVRSFMNEIDLVITGADAVTVNGAVVNKIGTSQIALAAHEARTNFVVAAETYKFAPRTILGELIQIEERPAGEVLPDEIAKGLPYVTARNPVFDVTPAEYIDLIITESGAIPPQMAYIIIRDYLGWDLSEFGKEFDIDHHD
ncbi:MAG: ribose 1,5-bisphosphate isomerase [Methanomicrobiales archaeon]|nr:ribose 1,5-bisphosphate isomerase [Methanomicrobiales archaeon]